MKSKIPLKLNLVLFILLFVIVIYSGYILFEEVKKNGCYQLENDVVSIKLKPYSSERTQLIAVGDVGTGNMDQLKVSEGMAKVCEESGCDLVLLLGDNFYPSGVNSPNDQQFIKKFEQVYQKLKTPFFVVLGNHDVKQDALSQVMYSLKNDSWYMPNFEYEFETSNANFFGINTNCPFAYESLRKKLKHKNKANKSNEVKSPWSIVFGHHSVYSNGTHGDANVYIRSFWDWFLEDEVDLYLAGHNHNLGHYKTNKSKIDYVISGSGGAHYRSSEERKKLVKSKAANLYTFNDIGFVWLDITMENILMKFYDGNGEKMYEYLKTR